MHGDGLSFGKRKRNRCSMPAGGREASAGRSADLALPISFDREHEWLVVCTQSCTVVSHDLVKDPHIEFLVAKPMGPTRQTPRKRRGKPCAASICRYRVMPASRRWIVTSTGDSLHRATCA